MNKRFEALNGDDVVSVNPETFENLDIFYHVCRIAHNRKSPLPAFGTPLLIGEGLGERFERNYGN